MIDQANTWTHRQDWPSSWTTYKIDLLAHALCDKMNHSHKKYFSHKWPIERIHQPYLLLFSEVWLSENLWLFRRFWVIFSRDESIFNACLKHVGLLQQFCKSNQWTIITFINSQFIPGSRSNYAWVDILRTAQHKGIMYQSLALGEVNIR